MGEYPRDYILKRAEEKSSLWQVVTAGWLRHAELARKTVALVAQKANEPILEMLVEDGCFEVKIPMPVALLAEMFWSSDEECEVLLERVSKYPCVSL